MTSKEAPGWSLKEHALHRYFLWANRHREHFRAWAGEQGPAPKEQPGRRLWFQAAMAYLGYWFASLYVVVEGWTELGLEDEVIRGLLTSPNSQLLRRFRNAVFHFQPTYFDRRLTDLIASKEDAAAWAASLHDAFSDYFLRRFAALGALDEVKRQLQAAPDIAGLVHRPGMRRRSGGAA